MNIHTIRTSFLAGALLFAAGVPLAVSAQSTSSEIFELDTMVASAERWNRSRSSIPERVVSISSADAAFSNPATTADLLQSSGAILVQKSQLGGGSPVLRGFESSRVLLVVDGVRMNNAIYRLGHLQDVITIDNAVLDHTDILFGPASTLYGSDAIGGVMHFSTKKPLRDSTAFHASVRRGSAADEQTVHADFNLGSQRLASLSSFTLSRFEDLRIGMNADGASEDFGTCTQYVSRENDSDVVLRNLHPEVMVGSGYTQFDLLQKLSFAQSERLTHTLNIQYSTDIGNVPRYDRLLETKDGLPVYAQWDYGPQSRLFAALSSDCVADALLCSRLKSTLSFQRIDQDRISRKLNKNAQKNQNEDLRLGAINIDASKDISDRSVLDYGCEATYNDVQSTAFSRDIVTRIEGPAATRYPDGGNSLCTGAVYARLLQKLGSLFTANGGLRLSGFRLVSEFKNNPAVIVFPVKKTAVTKLAPSGSLGITMNLPSGTFLGLVASTGFRAPNVDDMSKYNEFTADGSVVVPNPDLSPEYAYNGELNLGQTLLKVLHIEAGASATCLNNAMVVRDTRFKGSDSVTVDGTRLRVQSIQNADRGAVYAAYAALRCALTPELLLKGTVNYTYGRYHTTTESCTDTLVPMDHMPPLFGTASLRFAHARGTVEGGIQFSGAKKLEDYSPSGEDNLAQAMARGMPAWCTVQMKSEFAVTKKVTLQAGVDNLFDVRYRQFASGMSGGGRNIWVAVRI